ncbi:MAG: hypothetical protein C6P36_14365 [Geobacillus sp.]|nr:MAG: hypothetical protein C6P36_14365 [Geobacillus sp.]
MSGGLRSNFALIVVLFILLILLGAVVFSVVTNLESFSNLYRMDHIHIDLSFLFIYFSRQPNYSFVSLTASKTHKYLFAINNGK